MHAAAAGRGGGLTENKVCVRYECDLDAQNKRGNSALHFSVAYGFQAISDFLIEHGARTDLANESGLTC